MNHFQRSIAEARDVLRGYGENGWSDKMDRALARHGDATVALAKQARGWFGGMGSLNDFVIRHQNDHRISPADETAVNNRLMRLTGNNSPMARKLAR